MAHDGEEGDWIHIAKERSLEEQLRALFQSSLSCAARMFTRAVATAAADVGPRKSVAKNNIVPNISTLFTFKIRREI